MICPRCKREIPNGSTSCYACGQPLTGYAPQPQPQPQPQYNAPPRPVAPQQPTAPQPPIPPRPPVAPQPAVNPANKFATILLDPEEKVVATLGNTNIETFLATGVVGSNYAILSDKRFYFKGKALTTAGVGFSTRKEQSVVNVEDITGTGFVTIKRIFLIILAVLFSVLGIFAFAMGTAIGEIEMMASIAIGSLLVSGIMMLIYALTKRTIFYISYAGGMIAFDLRFSAANAGAEFQKQLVLLKDKARKEYKK